MFNLSEAAQPVLTPHISLVCKRHHLDKMLVATAVDIHMSIAISCLPPVPTQGSAPVL